MSLILTIAAASLLAAPQASPADPIVPEDYPDWARRDDRSAAVVSRLVVAPDGSLVSCSVVESEGDWRLRDEMCAIHMRHRWLPAKDEAGQAAYGTVDQLTNLFIPNTDNGDWIAGLHRMADLEISVNRLPKGMRRRVELKLAVQVGADGTATSCKADREGQLAQVACGEVMKLAYARLAPGGAGPVPYVTQRRVAFVVGTAPAG